MRRALIATLGLAGTAVTVIPVLAAPAPVDTGRTAGITVSTKLPGGDTLRLDFRALQLSAGPRLVIDAVRCDAGDCVTRVYGADLPDGALTIDTAAPTAKLTTILDGRTLTIRWKQMPGGGYTVGGGTIEGDGQDTFGSEYAGTSADTTVSYDGTGCQGTGGVGNGAVVDTGPVTGGEVARPLRALHLPDGTALRC